jgi:uncharacterized membrane protein YjfL (UPF0719 family)
MNPWNIDVAPLMLSLAHVVTGVLVLVVAKLLKSALSPYRTDEEMTSKDNPAFGLAVAGYYVAVAAIYIGAVRPVAADEVGTVAAFRAIVENFAWALGGIVALAFSRWLMNRFLVSGARCSDEIVANRNTAAGAVECGVYLASGLVLAGALREPGGSLVTTVVFFLLSQFVLLLLGRLYQLWSGYGIAREICGGNLSAGVAFGLTLVALSLLMFKATSGEFIDWTTNLTFFAFDAVIGFALLMGLRWVTDLALMPDARIADEIVRDRNVNVGLLEGAVALSVAGLILFVF